jgi:DNA mismatch repair protein MutL
MIRILPDILSNQIAAGEVVQRPASVVKELVENSIDAGAGRITIEIDKGGKSLIRVSDNGAGLPRDQALLAIERYATSKIHTQADLFAIQTFGFRGEALPSIASVSRFCLVTRPHDADTATRVEMAGGKLLQVSDAGAPAGTMVEVKHLFFNTPARRKFLKAEATEAGHIADTLSGMALGNPATGFRLFASGRLVRNFPPGQDLLHRAMLVLGKDVAGQLYPLEHVLDHGAGPIRISGVCASPAKTRSTANRIYLFVNHRLVHDKGVVAAVFRGYAGRIMKGRFPVAVVCCDLPCDQVDVNVHPSKREIKFLAPQPVYQAVAAAVSNALANARDQVAAYTGSIKTPESRPFAPTDRTGPDPDFDLYQAVQAPLPWDASRTVPAISLASRPSHRPAAPHKWTDQPDGKADPQGSAAVPPSLENPCARVLPDTSTPPDMSAPQDQVRESGTDVYSDQRSDHPRVLGQALGTYIIAEQNGTLMMVDQHAAHERVVYEGLKLRHGYLPRGSQYLLVPETLELSAGEADLLSGILSDLADLGLVIEPFGGTTFVIKAVPPILGQQSVTGLVTGMVETLMETGDFAVKEQWLDACLISMACHHAVRAHKSLTLTEMETLLKDLSACENPFHCPHGRPTMVTFDKYQMEKLFKRVV